MQLSTILALAPFLGMALAAPKQHEKFHHKAKRDIVWYTVTEEVIDTVYETTTVYLNPGDVPAPTPTPVDSSTGLGALQQPSSTSTSTTTTSTTTPAAAPSPQAPQPQQPSPSPSPPSDPSPSPSPPAASPSPPAPSPQQPSPPAASPSTPPSTGGSSSGGAAPSFAGTTLTGASQAVPDCGDGCQGQATFYAVGLGSCGQTSSPSDMIVAVPDQIMGSLSSGSTPNPLCGKQVKVNIIEGVEPVTATIADKCGGCVTPMDLDMSTGLFDALGGDQNHGRYTNMTWWWA